MVCEEQDERVKLSHGSTLYGFLTCDFLVTLNKLTTSSLDLSHLKQVGSKVSEIVYAKH